MNPAISLCAHLASDSLAELVVAPDDVIEWQDGPIVAVVRCTRCGAAGLLDMLDWRDAGRLRVYALAGVDAAAVALYQRNLARGSCDLARRERELEALVACAGPPARLVALDSASGAVVQSAAWPPDAKLPADGWRDRVSGRTDPGWFARLRIGVAPTASDPGAQRGTRQRASEP